MPIRHKRLQYPLHNTILYLALRDLILKAIARIKKKPIYAAFFFLKAYKKPWKFKSTSDSIHSENALIGEEASTDYIISSTPSIIPQVTGKLSNK